VVSGGSSALRIEIRRGLEGGCSGSDVVYESILTLESEVPPQRVRVEVVGTRR
jgi:hypothetical protein